MAAQSAPSLQRFRQGLLLLLQLLHCLCQLSSHTCSVLRCNRWAGFTNPQHTIFVQGPLQDLCISQCKPHTLCVQLMLNRASGADEQ